MVELAISTFQIKTKLLKSINYKNIFLTDENFHK